MLNILKGGREMIKPNGIRSRIGIIVMIGALVCISCATGMKKETMEIKIARAPAALLARPNVVKPAGQVEFVGANFEPGEKINVAIMAFLGVKQLLGEGKGLKVNELGSFQIKDNAPFYPGVYPVRVYDESGEIIAATVLIVEGTPPAD